jgi:hypothetical protein
LISVYIIPAVAGWWEAEITSRAVWPKPKTGGSTSGSGSRGEAQRNNHIARSVENNTEQKPKCLEDLQYQRSLIPGSAHLSLNSMTTDTLRDQYYRLKVSYHKKLASPQLDKTLSTQAACSKLTMLFETLTSALAISSMSSLTTIEAREESKS